MWLDFRSADSVAEAEARAWCDEALVPGSAKEGDELYEAVLVLVHDPRPTGGSISWARVQAELGRKVRVGAPPRRQARLRRARPPYRRAPGGRPLRPGRRTPSAARRCGSSTGWSRAGWSPADRARAARRSRWFRLRPATGSRPGSSTYAGASLRMSWAILSRATSHRRSTSCSPGSPSIRRPATGSAACATSPPARRIAARSSSASRSRAHHHLREWCSGRSPGISALAARQPRPVLSRE